MFCQLFKNNVDLFNEKFERQKLRIKSKEMCFRLNLVFSRLAVYVVYVFHFSFNLFFCFQNRSSVISFSLSRKHFSFIFTYSCLLCLFNYVGYFIVAAICSSLKFTSFGFPHSLTQSVAVQFCLIFNNVF